MGIECILKFGEKAALKKTKVPSDYIRGVIMQGNNCLSVLEGNYLEKLEFDGIKYWDFETTPIFTAERP